MKRRFSRGREGRSTETARLHARASRPESGGLAGGSHWRERRYWRTYDGFRRRSAAERGGLRHGRRRVRALAAPPQPARTHRQPRKTSQVAISTPTATRRVDDTSRWGAPTSTRPCEITAWCVPSSSYSTLTKIG